MADPGRRERRREVAVDPVAQADQDAGRETGLGFGQDAGQGVARAAPQRLEPAARVVGGRLDRQRPRRRASRPRRSARGTRRRASRVAAGSTLDDDAVARDDRRVARQRRRDAERTVGAGVVRRASRSAGRRAASRWPRPTSVHGPSPSGGSVERRRLRPERPQSERDERGAERRPGAASRTPQAAAGPRGRAGSRPARARSRRRGGSGATCPAATAAAIAPIARRLLRPISADRHEVLELGERLLADELARPEVVDRRERLSRRATRGSWPRSPARSRAACRARPPWRGSGRSARRPARRHRLIAARRRPASTPRSRPASSRDGTRIWSPSLSGAARFSSRPARSASTRGPYPPAAATRSPTRASGGQPEDARVVDGADDLDDDEPRPAPPAVAWRADARRDLGEPPANGDPAVDGDRTRRARLPNASTNAPTARRDRGPPTTRRRARDRQASPAASAGAGGSSRPGPTGSSRTRHGVAFGSTHRPPRRDGRATTSRSDATSRHVGGTSDAARRRRPTLATAAYLRLIQDQGATLVQP